MSYWPAFDVPSWNALAKNESYGSVRNCTLVPVAPSNSGMIFLKTVMAPSSNAPMTSLPPACAALGLAAADAPAADAAADETGADDAAPPPHAASTAPAAAVLPRAAPRRS